jgi:hypothetical protein
VTEADWLNAKDPGPMAAYLREHPDAVSERKLRLLAAGWCRSIAYLLPNERSRTAIDTIERRADGQATLWELADARSAALAAEDSDHPQAARAVYWAASRNLPISLASVGDSAGEAIALDAIHQVVVDPHEMGRVYDQTLHEVSRDQANLVRECLGNPFREVAIEAGWLRWSHGIVPRLAQAIYEERAFDRLPILADALEEAGCTDAGLLNHLRAGGAHVRGCFVLDLLLGKG